MDSRIETYKHIQTLQGLMGLVNREMQVRSEVHDQSKLKSPEVEYFDKYTEKLAGSTYGSDEYKQFLEEMKPGLQHHYSKNRHHPEYHKNGFKDMDLMDILEMLCDWMAAVRRHNNGNIFKSIEINQNRFGYSDDVKNMLTNTARAIERMELLKKDSKP